MHELGSNEHTAPDDLFLERFEAFMNKSLAEIRAFSEREAMSFEKTRRHVAQWHSKYLFQQPQSHSTDSPGTIGNDRAQEARTVLMQTSHILENLCEVAGIESFLLAVDPYDASNEGFLGGSITGREFWRGFRNGGDHGARTFQQYCIKNQEGRSGAEVVTRSSSTEGIARDTTPATPKQSAKTVKQELYENVRNALRSACGIRNAEMKWTNHDRLHAYGVYLVGWPKEIPPQNPSSLKADQNKRLLELLDSGKMKFMKIATSSNDEAPVPSSPPPTSTPADEESENFLSWIHYDESQPSGQSDNTKPSPIRSSPSHRPASSPQDPPRPPKRPRIHEQSSGSEDAEGT